MFKFNPKCKFDDYYPNNAILNDMWRKKTRSLKENESISICPNKRNNSDAIWHTVAKNALQIVCVSCFTMLATFWAHAVLLFSTTSESFHNAFVKSEYKYVNYWLQKGTVQRNYNYTYMQRKRNGTENGWNDIKGIN